ncbi:hypothetical protein U1Q18_038729 [Sarracenia purpurea var. burkii]
MVRLQALGENQGRIYLNTGEVRAATDLKRSNIPELAHVAALLRILTVVFTEDLKVNPLGITVVIAWVYRDGG